MKTRLWPYVTYALALFVLSIGAFAVADELRLADWTGYALTYGVGVPIATLLARKIAPLTYRALIISSLLVAVARSLVALAVLYAIAMGSPAMSINFYTEWLIVDLALCIGAPLGWLWVIRKVSSNNSFKGMPLRGTP